MKIDTVKIGYEDVEICLEDLQDEDCFGYFEAYPRPRISIHEGLKPLYIGSTIFHEILEAISSIYGLELTEGQIRTLETTLVEVVRRNPENAKRWIDLLMEAKVTYATTSNS